jgi:hypothetical protein
MNQRERWRSRDMEERRIRLSDEQMDSIAEKAAERALAKVYEDVGKSVAKKLLWLLGVGALGIVALLSHAGVKVTW